MSIIKGLDHNKPSLNPLIYKSGLKAAAYSTLLAKHLFRMAVMFLELWLLEVMVLSMK